MIHDTGASLSIINRGTFQRIQKQSPAVLLQPSQACLQTYTGERIPILGVAEVSVRYDGAVATLAVQVVDGEGPNLLGRDWIKRLEVTPDQPRVNLVGHSGKLEEVLDRHTAVFDGSLGCLQGMKVTLAVDDTAKPKFFKPRPVPFLMKTKVEEELDRLTRLGIISPVQHSPWAAPIVPVTKKDGSVINQASPTEHYPLPRAEDLFADLSGGKYFTKLDMSNAYLQLQLSDSSKQVVTINTHKGLFHYNRLPFGVASAPAIFQRTMETLLPTN